MKKNGFTAIRESEAPAACHSPGDPEILYVQAVEEFGAALARLARGYGERLRDIRRTYWRQGVVPLIPGFALWLVCWVAAPQYIFPGRVLWPLFGIFFGGSIAATFCWSLWMSRRDAKQIDQELAARESLRGT